MKLGIVLNSSDPETAWNALRLGNQALGRGHEVRMFLLGSGVEIVNIKDSPFDVPKVLNEFVAGTGNLLACGTCLTFRQQQGGVCPVSTMAQLVDLIEQSDKLVTLG